MLNSLNFLFDLQKWSSSFITHHALELSSAMSNDLQEWNYDRDILAQNQHSLMNSEIHHNAQS